jgi:DNA-binding HxlR family transcriptional regulator
MSNGIESLHSILKDQTRRKILLFLNQNGVATYSELMEKTGVTSTGTLNYHLKALEDLLSKTEAGQYTLTQKGKAACNMIEQIVEKENSGQQKKKWSKRYWKLQFIIPLIILVCGITLYFNDYINVDLFSDFLFIGVGSLIFVFFEFYVILRPLKNTQEKNDSSRTIKDILVLGHSLMEVKEEVHKWIKTEKNTVETERDDFISGRLAVSNPFVTVPKCFEVSLKAEKNGVMVHTEGWVDVVVPDVRELSFSNDLVRYGSLPRREGWKAINNLWTRLEAMSK